MAEEMWKELSLPVALQLYSEDAGLCLGVRVVASAALD